MSITQLFLDGKGDISRCEYLPFVPREIANVVQKATTKHSIEQKCNMSTRVDLDV